jgi:hypothetical protein
LASTLPVGTQGYALPIPSIFHDVFLLRSLKGLTPLVLGIRKRGYIMFSRWFQKPGQVIRNFTAPIHQKLMQDPDRQTLNEIRKQLTDIVFDVTTMFDEYATKLDEYYEKHPPFASRNEDDNFVDFNELVKDAFSAGSHQLLDRWAVTYPLAHQEQLARPISHYVRGFEGYLHDWDQVAAQDGWPKEAKAYWEYLVSELTAKLSVPLAN